MLPKPTERATLTPGIDWGLLLICLLLAVAGFFSIYASEYRESQEKLIDLSLNHGKQLIWIGVSIVVGFVVLMSDFRLYHTLAYAFYAVGIGLLLVTLAIGKTVAGAQGWLSIGGFQFQTAELAKLTTALAMAKYCGEYGFSMQSMRQRTVAFAIVFLPMGLVLLQNDTGSALVFLSFFILMYREGLNALYLVIPLYLGTISVLVLATGRMLVLGAIGALLAVAIVFVRRSKRAILGLLAIGALSAGMVMGVDFAFNKVLKPYQRDRVEVILGQKEDFRGAGYNLHQSLIAIGSGGVTGKGFLNGTQTKFNFVPEQSTDFIFCTIGEEGGFVGSIAVLLLYLAFMYRLIGMAERQKFDFNRCYMYGILGIVFIHFAINISMVLGLFPVIGIPLPFVSYGGSSLLSFTLMVAIALKLDAANSRY